MPPARALLLVAFVTAGCLGPGLDECAGRICPRGLVCAPLAETCVLPAQIDACQNRAEGAACLVFDDVGQCRDGLCDALGATEHEVSISKPGGGSGTVISEPAGISCGDTCSAAFSQGTTLRLIATGTNGSTFSGWGAPCAGLDACEVTVTARTALTATFVPPPPPIIETILPPAAGLGERVTILGRNLLGTSIVTFNGVPQLDMIVFDTWISTVVPEGATSGPVRVTTPGGTAGEFFSYEIVYADVKALSGLEEPVSGCVELTYRVFQEQYRPADILVEVDPGTGTFQPATSGRANDDHDVVTSPTGTLQSFRWNSSADFPSQHITNARVRVSASIPGFTGSTRIVAMKEKVVVSNTGAPNGKPPGPARPSHAWVVPCSEGFASPMSIPTGRLPRAVAVGDLSGDQHLDLVVANWNDGTVTVLLGHGDGTFEPGTTHEVGTAPVSLAIGDLNRDGREDVVVANQNDGIAGPLAGRITVLMGGGPRETLLPAVQHVVGLDPRAVALANMNGDAAPDLVVADRGLGAILILIGDREGGFQLAWRQPFELWPTSIAVADLNRDGLDDVVVTTITGTLTFLGRPKGELHLFGEDGLSADSAALGDLDGDGELDLVRGNGGWVIVARGNGDGTFGEATFLEGLPGAAWVAVADLAPTGPLDLIVGSPSGPLLVATGRGDGTFFPAVEIEGVDDTWSPALGDLDGDRKIDLVVVEPGADQLKILLAR